MALYVIDINERKGRGRAMKKLLETDSVARLIPIDEYEALEDRALAEVMAKSRNSPLLTDEETQEMFIQLREKLK